MCQYSLPSNLVKEPLHMPASWLSLWHCFTFNSYVEGAGASPGRRDELEQPLPVAAAANSQYIQARAQVRRAFAAARANIKLSWGAPSHSMLLADVSPNRSVLPSEAEMLCCVGQQGFHRHAPHCRMRRAWVMPTFQPS
jgi:hypothetical protein